MDPVQTLDQIQAHYRQVLELTQEQNRRLRSGDLAALPSLLADKSAALTAATQLTQQLQHSRCDLTTGTCQASLATIAELLRGIMQAEEQCPTPSTPSPPTPNRAAAAAAYGKTSRFR